MALTDEQATAALAALAPNNGVFPCFDAAGFALARELHAHLRADGGIVPSWLPHLAAQEAPMAKAAPLKRVRFRHPETGDEEHGHIHASGHKGATVIDGTGKSHQVHHGHYMHHDPTPPIDRAALITAATSHLELGPRAPMAHLAAICLLRLGGVKKAEKLQGSDLIVDGDEVKIRPAKKRVREPRALAAILAHLARQTDGPLFEGAKPDHVRAYTVRFGSQADGSTEMAKATAQLIPLAKPTSKPRTWVLGGYTCEYRSDGPLGLLTLRKASLPLPFHEIAPSFRAAQRMARRMVREFNEGKTPYKGVFAPDLPTS